MRKTKAEKIGGGSVPVRPRDNLVMMVPVMANPTRNGQLRLHSRLKNTGHGSNFGIFSLLRFLPFSLSLLLFLSSGGYL
jgi:hypothetical protein